MNTKLTKTMHELEKVRAKLEHLQAQMKDLEETKTKQENEEFIRLVRAAGLSPDELELLLNGGESHAED